jgi:hypothetical protein
VIDVVGIDKTEIPKVIDFGIYGGDRGPHLHYKGNLYLLNERQWRDFTGRIKREFSARLEAAETIGFEQILDMDEILPGV